MMMPPQNVHQWMARRFIISLLLILLLILQNYVLGPPIIFPAPPPAAAVPNFQGGRGRGTRLLTRKSSRKS